MEPQIAYPTCECARARVVASDEGGGLVGAVKVLVRQTLEIQIDLPGEEGLDRSMI